MSTFAFNKIFIIESLTPNELQTGTELEKRINQWASSQGIDCQVVTYQVHSMQEWEIAWNGIYSGIETMGNIPIIHLEMHGNQTCLGIDGGKNGEILLEDVFKKVQYANVLSHNNIFLSLAVCMGLNIIRGLKVYEPMPFCGVFGSLETLKNNDLLENYTIFYKAFLSSLNLDRAKQALLHAGINADKYQLLKPEEIFMNAYLGYLETYKTDEQIVNKAISAASDAGVVFKNDEEKQRFIRDYRCRLLLSENKEYQHAVDEFFIFNKYPENRSRFVTPDNIYEFKEYAGKRNYSWLLQKRIMTDEDIKGLSLIILNEVDNYCSKNNIKYSLAYGTLLGAVRHKGFIPWDDDIDIIMPRDDYERFVTGFNNSNSQLFVVVSSETDSSFRFPIAKVICNATIKNELNYTRYGYAIDLFPIDKIITEKEKASSLLKYQSRIWNLFMIKAMKWDKKRSLIKNLFLYFIKAFAFFIPYILMHKLMHKKFMKYHDIEDNYSLGCLCAAYGMREMMPKEVFANYIRLPFEGIHYLCIEGYDKYLTNLYGDYMKYPPKEKQVSHHDFTAYWK